jgi:hypothetical protein
MASLLRKRQFAADDLWKLFRQKPEGIGWRVGEILLNLIGRIRDYSLVR